MWAVASIFVESVPFYPTWLTCFSHQGPLVHIQVFMKFNSVFFILCRKFLCNSQMIGVARIVSHEACRVLTYRTNSKVWAPAVSLHMLFRMSIIININNLVTFKQKQFNPGMIFSRFPEIISNRSIRLSKFFYY